MGQARHGNSVGRHVVHLQVEHPFLRVSHLFDPACPGCAPSPGMMRTAAHEPIPGMAAPYRLTGWHRPEHLEQLRDAPDGGTAFFHGTGFEPERTDSGRDIGGQLDPDSEAESEYEPEISPNGRAHKHWNTDLGTHFTVHHPTAAQFAQGMHGRVAHVSIHMANPKVYATESEMNRHAVDWALAHGHKFLPENAESHDNFVRGYWHQVTDPDYEPGSGDDFDDHFSQMGYSEHQPSWSEREGISEIDHRAEPVQNTDHNAAWLQHHPHRYEITSGFEQHLRDQGHDGVLYGNEVEGPKEHPSAIAFRDTPVTMHHWEWLHHPEFNRRSAALNEPHSRQELIRHAEGRQPLYAPADGSGDPACAFHALDNQAFRRRVHQFGQQVKLIGPDEPAPAEPALRRVGEGRCLDCTLGQHAQQDLAGVTPSTGTGGRTPTARSPYHPGENAFMGAPLPKDRVGPFVPLRQSLNALGMWGRWMHTGGHEDHLAAAAAVPPRAAGRGKPRHDAPDVARRAGDPQADAPAAVGADFGRGVDRQGPPRPEELRPLAEHPKVDSDLARLPRSVRQTYRTRVDELRAGIPHSSTHTLHGPLKGWFATSLGGNQYRLVHRYAGDELQVLSAGNHDESYNTGIRRIASIYTVRLEHGRRNENNRTPSAEGPISPPYLEHPVGVSHVQVAVDPYDAQGNHRSHAEMDNEARNTAVHMTSYPADMVTKADIISLEAAHTAVLIDGYQHDPERVWYHGTRKKFDRFDNRHRKSNKPDWNTAIGPHFTSVHEVAKQFAGEHGNVIPVKLRMHNPKVYDSEDDMTTEVAEHERQAGNTYGKYGYKHQEFHPDENGEDENFDYERDDAENVDAHFEYNKDAHPNDYSPSQVNCWLRMHPDRQGIVKRFKQRLREQGHDGIIYGNEQEHEGDGFVRKLDPETGFIHITDAPRHASAVPLDAKQIEIHKEGARFTPNQRVFGPTHGLDHRLWDGDHLKPEVRAYILKSITTMWAGKYRDWSKWAKVYFAGSEASEWTSETLEGNNDFDVLVGVDYRKFRQANPQYKTWSNQKITDMLNAGLRQHNGPVMIDGTGPWDRTTYVNPDSYDIRRIKPYAAYDVGKDTWAVHPPTLPDWSWERIPKQIRAELRAVDTYARAILKLPEPLRTQQGAALWEHIHSSRNRAFSERGEGWADPFNLLEKMGDQLGWWHELYLCHQRWSAGEGLAPTGWSNDNPYGTVDFGAGVRRVV